MNVENNHLVRDINDINEHIRHLYTLVPNDLMKSATMALHGRNEVYVSLKSGGKLSQFASGKRKGKRAIEKLSKKKNKPQ